MFEAELIAKIRQLFYAEHWRIGTIAAELGVHPDGVRRAIGSSAFHRSPTARRQSQCAPYLAFITEILRKYPRLRATRIYEMVRRRGYPGSVVGLRRAVRTLRPTVVAEVYQRLDLLAGDQAQVDWASFGKLAVGRAERRLMCFVMVLSYSRALYIEFALDETLESFLRAHRRAFEWFGGSTRIVLHDNTKSAVIARRGAQVVFHPRYSELAGHYYFAPQPCWPRRANEKGRVERAIRYVRDAFFAARTFADLDDLNAQARHWCATSALERRWTQDPKRSVAEVLAEERPRLNALPLHPLTIECRLSVYAKKTIYVRFDGNDYTIPPSAVGRSLCLLATDIEVRLLDGQVEVARHRRSYDSRRQVVDPAHAAALSALKRRAQRPLLESVLKNSVPESEAFLDRAFQTGETSAAVVRQLEVLLELYGAPALRRAIEVALAGGTPRLASLRYILERHRRAAKRSTYKQVDLGDRPELRALHVKPHDLEVYDELSHHQHDDDQQQ